MEEGILISIFGSEDPFAIEGACRLLVDDGAYRKLAARRVVRGAFFRGVVGGSFPRSSIVAEAAKVFFGDFPPREVRRFVSSISDGEEVVC